MPLPAFWQAWAEMAVSRILSNATFEADAETVGACSGDETEVSLMQVEGRRLTMGERQVRPRRPREWLAFVQVLSERAPRIVERVHQAMRSWLVRRVTRVGYVFYSLGLMLRDTLHAVEPALSGDDEREADELIRGIQQQLEDYPDRNHRWDLAANVPLLVQDCLRQAVRLDELDTELYPVDEGSHQARGQEEVRLMYVVNNLVRSRLPRDPGTRAGCVRLLIQTVRAMLGSEARHLRRMGICLHGLQMIGIRGPVSLEGDSATWLTGVADEIHLLAGEEVLALRQWLLRRTTSAR